jgi:hypothetical protein
MHKDLSWRLVELQLKEAQSYPGLFDGTCRMAEVCRPNIYIEFQGREQVRLARLDCTNYDLQPVQVRPVEPSNRADLSVDRFWEGSFPEHPHLGGAKFLCIEGTRDYYTHDSHIPSATGQRWETRRSTMRLVDLIRFMKYRFEMGAWG